jgi:drug/metabolite transporter (DMT)-like permease
MQGWGMLLGGGLLGVVGRVRGEGFRAVGVTPAALVALAYLVVGSSAVGYLIYFSLLERLGPTESNLVAYCEPVTAAVASWALLGDVLGVRALGGFALTRSGSSA